MEAQRKGFLFWKGVGLFLITGFFAGVFGHVPDNVVYTDQHKTVQIGDSVVLKCQFRGAPLAVYWKKGDDPRTAPNLVSWIPGDPVTGLCEGERPCQIMEMNENFSLSIKEVSMAEQGRYICRVSSYKGILIHNFTDVKLFSPPQDPVPVIDQCAVMEPSAIQSCSFSTSSPINITCLASRYYPDLDLFFLHGHNRITDQVIIEWTNHDGTKNKSISIKGSPSETPYVCVAWDIPGVKGQRVATILLRSPPVSPSVTLVTTMTSAVTTWTTETKVDSRSRPAKIVVPVFIIALAGGTLLIVYCWLKCRRSAPSSGEKDVEETQPMVQTIKVHVEGMVSYYELWSLAYGTPKEDMGKVSAALKELGVEISSERTRSEHVYDALCHWKKTAKRKEQAQKFRDALEDAELGNRWQQIYGERRQATTEVSEGIFEQILLDLESPRKIKKFLHKLISKGETTVGNTKEKGAIVPNTDLNRDNPEELEKLVSHPKSNVGGEDDESDDVSDAENYDEVSDAEKKKDVVQEAMRKLKEWNRGPFTENPYVLLSLALERVGCTHVSRTIFDGIVSFYELRSLLYYMETPDMNKLHNLVKELGEIEDAKVGLGPQQIYDALCRWKEKHNKGDQSKLLRDALDRADLSEAWLKIPETRKDTARVSEGTLKHILIKIRDPIKIQQFIGKLILGNLRHQNGSDDMDVIQQAMDTLRKWSKEQFDENPMILLSRALERGGCNPVDRTFFYGTITYFELWSLVHAYKDDMKTLCHAVRALGIQDVYNTKTFNHVNRVYMLLCEWKNQHHACDQLLALKVLLFEAGLLKFCEDLTERRNRTDVNISDDTLEHILWHVKYPNKMKSFLLELIQNLLEPRLDVSTPLRDIIRAALEELKQWRKRPFDENPVVQLSLALESAKCSPVDRTFFKVPSKLQAPIKQGEVEVFVHKLTSRHCKRLANSSPRINKKTVLKISDENNDDLFDTKKMISEWIANMECSNYEKRCQLDDALIKIGRHDMTDLFLTIGYRRETEEALAQPHPASKYYNHDTIFDDDLISLARLMSCLDAGTMSAFFNLMSVGISDQEVLREWRDSNLTSKSPNGSLERIFSQITEFMGDKTYIKYVTDDELGFIESQLKTADMKERLLSGLHIRRDEKKGQWIMAYNDTNQKKGLPECLVNKTPRKYMYKAELVQVAFNLLMTDVFPVIQALRIDQEKAKKYRRQSPDLEKGSLCLLIQLCRGTKQLEAYNRRDFLPILLMFGYADAAKSLYLDYEQSLSELSSIVSRLTEGKFQSFIEELGVSPSERAECSRTDQKAYRVEVMRIWKSKIRPVPYHYRMHIVTALQTIGCRDLAGEVLSGHHRGSAANDDVIRAIYSRLDRVQTNRLCKLLKLKPDEEQNISTTKIVNWVSKWMDEYDPSPKGIEGKSLDKFQPRKHMNNELFKAGCYELANEIMRLEFSRF